MRGFIEVTDRDLDTLLIGVHSIAYIRADYDEGAQIIFPGPVNSHPSQIDCRESYEEVKRKIEEASQ